jgi:hypothetical protein
MSHEGLRALLRDEGVSFQCIKTCKASADPDYEVKKACGVPEVCMPSGLRRRPGPVVRQHHHLGMSERPVAVPTEELARRSP